VPFVDVRNERGKLLCRFDPARDLVEFVERGQRSLVDLQDYRPGGRLAPVATLLGRPVLQAADDDPLNSIGPEDLKFAAVRSVP
jgi:hypothetical protein